MNPFEGVILADFLSSPMYGAVRTRLESFPARLTLVSGECGVTEVDNRYVVDSKNRAVEFLTAVTNAVSTVGAHDSSASSDMLLNERPTAAERRAILIKNVVTAMKALEFTIIPLVFISLDSKRKYNIYESILVKTVKKSGEVCLLDMVSRVYRNMEEFLKHNTLPYGILCYDAKSDSETEPEYKFKLVGWRGMCLRTVDVVFTMSNLIGSVGFLMGSIKSIPPFALLTIGSSFYITARGVWNYFDVGRFKGIKAEKTKLVNIIMMAVHIISHGLIFPCCFLSVQHLDGYTTALTGGAALASLVWLSHQLSFTKSFW